ncbi:CynX/NimT family MFS transporter [Pengzhenrongella sicca]|uniref:MFS transporter n=1 Tax=Pengzhenrongella sicca TaxID=2819238 RepID=A0A8A4ZCM2_9MICO|nr:MFS transporter [Pengzhenrongella sicca]QTE28769.1 MFS transporter [Pengzhenrongella sicca]
MVAFGRPQPWHGRGIALLGILLVGLNLRIAVGAVSPILDVVRVDLALTGVQAGVLGTIPVASFALFGSLAPLLARRFGLEPTLVAAMVASAGGEIVRSSVATPSAFLVWTVIALAGMGMGNVLLPPLVKRYFADRIGAVTSMYSVAMCFSTTLPALLAVPIAREYGWRVTLASWSVIGLVAAVPWVVVIARSARLRAELGGLWRGSARREPGRPGSARARGRVWRSPLAWSLAGLFGLNSLNVYAMFAWLPQILGDAGISAEHAGQWLALFGILALPGSFVVPSLAARMNSPFSLVVVFGACFVSGYAGLMLAPTHGTLAWIVLLGVAPSAFPLVITLLNLRTRTQRGGVALSGFVQGVGYGLAGLGPVVVGVLYVATGGWAAAIAFLLATVVLMVLAGAIACRPIMLEDSWT